MGIDLALDPRSSVFYTLATVIMKAVSTRSPYGVRAQLCRVAFWLASSEASTSPYES